jgi:hypothetical protein
MKWMSVNGNLKNSLNTDLNIPGNYDSFEIQRKPIWFDKSDPLCEIHNEQIIWTMWNNDMQFTATRRNRFTMSWIQHSLWFHNRTELV